MKVLVVEDDDKLAGVLLRGLNEQQIESSRARDFAEGRERLLFGAYDVIVLDVMLPGGSGMNLCRLARERGITTPILMLTARDTIDDRVRGLETGADDYMTKPFAFRELSARLHALGRRQPALKPALHCVADLEVDLRARTVRRGGREISLTGKEFALLHAHNREAKRSFLDDGPGCAAMPSEELGVEHPLIFRQMVDEHVAIQGAVHGGHVGSVTQV